MNVKQSQKYATHSRRLYQIAVQGALKEDWRDWFNGMLIDTEGPNTEVAATTFICKVRDQAELIGIINWLHNMNVTIEKVCLFTPGVE